MKINFHAIFRTIRESNFAFLIRQNYQKDDQSRKSHETSISSAALNLITLRGDNRIFNLTTFHNRFLYEGS